MSWKKIKILIIFLGIAFCAGGLLMSARAETDIYTKNINVQMNVPDDHHCNSTCGNNSVECNEQCDLGGANGVCSSLCSISCTNKVPDCSATVSGLSTVANFTTATISWTFADADIPPSTQLSCGYVNYGRDINYGSIVAPTASGTAWRANLSGLATGTVYYFSFYCTDGAFAPVLVSNSFVTADTTIPTTSKKLIVKARPEKRSVLAGGNYGFTGYLKFYNPTTKQSVVVDDLDFGASGTTVFNDFDLPVGSNLSVAIKGRAYLAKIITGVNTTGSGDVILDFTAGGNGELLAGDVQSVGAQSNWVNGLDYAATYNLLGRTASLADFDNNNKTNGLDYSITFVNLGKRGDNF